LERASKMHSDKQRIVKPRLNVAKPGTIRVKKGA
jgi:hypothetical protein